MKLRKKIKEYVENRFSYDTIYSFRYLKSFFWQINWLKTLWFNFKVLPLKKAIKLPFIISYNVKINSIGKIELTGDIHPGMVSIGVIKISDYDSNANPIYFTNKGTLKIEGNTKIHPGVRLYIAPTARIDLGRRVNLGFNTKIISYKHITIGNDSRISWECQIFDTDFHFLHNIEKDKYYQRTKPVIIGENVFIGNRSTIGKGTIIPNGSVISCVSKVNGDFKAEGENLLITGNPAKIIKKGVNMGSGWFPKEEERISKMQNE